MICLGNFVTVLEGDDDCIKLQHRGMHRWLQTYLAIRKRGEAHDKILRRVQSLHLRMNVAIHTGWYNNTLSDPIMYSWPVRN